MLRHARTLFLVAVLEVAIGAMALAPGAAGAWEPDPPRYGVVAERNVPVTMSDGVTLMADVFRPAEQATGRSAAGRFPVILSITDYRKGTPLARGPLRTLIERGYIHTIVDSRGTGSAGGHFGFFSEREQRDAAEVVRWAARLDGSNGKVGMHGSGLVGIAQLGAAALVGRGSPLKAIMPIVPHNDLYRDFGVAGGMLSGFGGVLWLGLLRPLEDTVIPPEDVADDPAGALTRWLERSGNITGTTAAFNADAAMGGQLRYDGPFYEERSPGRRALARIVRNDVRVLLVGGWYDVSQRGTPLDYAGLQNAKAGRPQGRPMRAGQRISARYQLVEGDWFHVTSPTLQMLALRWFDTWLKGRKTGMERDRLPLHLFEVGSNRWVDTDLWPIRGARARTFYLDRGPTGTANSRNDGALAHNPPAESAGEDALPYSQPESCSLLLEQYLTVGFTEAQNPCIKDDRPGQATALTYTTAPFRRPTSIAGPITATLYARSDRPETSTILTLQDIAPDGRSRPLTGGVQLGSFRANDESRSWRMNGKLVMPYHPFTEASRRSMDTGRVERIDVEIYAVLASLAPGHRLRLTITTNLAPAFLLPVPESADLLGGTTRYQRSSDYPSHINVPLIPSNRLRTSPVDWARSRPWVDAALGKGR